MIDKEYEEKHTSTNVVVYFYKEGVVEVEKNAGGRILFSIKSKNIDQIIRDSLDQYTAEEVKEIIHSHLLH